MVRIVMKFGGTSVANPERIARAAKLVQGEVNRGNQVAVIVSAMGKTTDDLLKLAVEVNPKAGRRELDMLLATGEQVTASLLAMAIAAQGLEARSYTGWQAGVTTESVHGNARIEQVHADKIVTTLESGAVAVITGFQGADSSGELTTLGRGGSDTSAVAIAIAIDAAICDIYTDVEGVFTTDPRLIRQAKKLEEISYDEMLEIANLGAGVLHPRAVEFAKNHQMPLRVRPAHMEGEGTIIKEEIDLENNLIVRGIAFERDIIRITVMYDVPYNGSLANIFTALANHHVNVDIIVQTIMEGVQPSVSFSIKKEDFAEAINVLETEKDALGYSRADFEVGLSKVSIVGSGMVSNPGVAAQMFEILRGASVPVKMVSTSEIKVSVVIPESDVEIAVAALHNQFGLDAN
ncbi:aspartate kinase [Sporosarcina sp. E16_3]|uniref:aspartate kinase n=1 Tax=Sporosarcina sp. E16_3 TaxID=2789293 RepID=UPI001A936EF1|nr:aspartate kinase [Sporosarcina sp. E16_3]MBO0601405.1 aspartate kinase [Sporosarcina sp. E16_3]